MTVRSYAQNFEDVLLHRVLGHVHAGTYVDVGAGHPRFGNVTRLFYELGWSGIDVEPLPALAAALAADRPRDVVLHAAVVSGTATSVSLAVVQQWDELSTTDASRRGALEAEGRSLEHVDVPAVRLDDLVRDFGAREIHFLKVDVEGAELDVLSTLDLRVTRPWVVVVEVLSARREMPSRDALHEKMTSHDYVHAYFDGLNDFFVEASRSEELLSAFAVPVNVTDDFILAWAQADEQLDLVGGRLGLAPPVQISELLQRLEALLADRIRFEAQVQDLQRGDGHLQDVVPPVLELLQQALGDSTAAGPEQLLTAVQSLVDLHREAELRAAVSEARIRTQDDGITQLEASVQELRLAGEAQEQVSFERERLIAWYAVERQRLASDLQEQTAQHEAARAERDLLRHRVDFVLGSATWRMTLPLRVLGRPKDYLTGLRGR